MVARPSRGHERVCRPDVASSTWSSGIGRTLSDVEIAGRRPEWVDPTWHQVGDLSCLALGGVVEQQATECAGMVAAVAWVRGLMTGPITGRDNDPLSRQCAIAELWTAAAVQPGWPTPPLPELCAMLRVDYRRPLAVEPSYARGAWSALRWLTGTDNQPPLDLPTRNRDGSVASADQVYRALLARQRIVPAEDRASLRARAERVADRSKRLAELVASTAERIRQ